MDKGSVTGQVVQEIKSLGEETGKQLGEAGEEIVKGTVEELFGEGVQVSGEEQGVVGGDGQQVATVDQMSELQRRKEAEKERGLKRVRADLERYRQWQKQLKEELDVREEREEEQVKVAKKEEKKNFWRNLISRNRSKYAGTGEMVKTHN